MASARRAWSSTAPSGWSRPTWAGSSTPRPARLLLACRGKYRTALSVTENGRAAEDYVNPAGGVHDRAGAVPARPPGRRGPRHEAGANLAATSSGRCRQLRVGLRLPEAVRDRFVDFGTQQRIPKSSARFYSRVARSARSGPCQRPAETRPPQPHKSRSPHRPRQPRPPSATSRGCRVRNTRVFRGTSIAMIRSGAPRRRSRRPRPPSQRKALVLNRPVWPDPAPRHRPPPAGRLHRPRAHVTQHRRQRGLRALAPALGGHVEPGHRLAVELAAADRPVQQVLEAARQRARVLGRADHHRVVAAISPAARRPGRHRLAVVVGVERGQPPGPRTASRSTAGAIPGSCAARRYWPSRCWCFPISARSAPALSLSRTLLPSDFVTTATATARPVIPAA